MMVSIANVILNYLAAIINRDNRKMIDDTIELHRALQEAQGLDTTTEERERYLYRTACVKEDIRVLSQEFNAARTAELLNIPIQMVEEERAKMGEYNQRRRKFLETGDLDLPQPYGTPAVYTIFQR